ncbi:mitochondrial import receptor subunit TOM70 [Daphnia magna]|uniref:mitochondrial import receptor subunit TOM70 n=1 Tax=Daphnia magna TaxID=35525 RepID=UPI001E1BDCFF|nr:mitochondrial import receptor subunit TOM70 [Daphnia magna]
MAASTRAVSSSGLSLPKWQIALAIGAPVALGLGIWYYRSRTNKTQSAEKEDKQIKKNVADAAASVSVPIETQKDAKKVNGIGKINEKESVAPVVEEEEDPFKQAQTYKNKGNKYFKEGKYSDAIKCYQQAIDVCPKDKIQDVSTFHQNRAAAFEQLKNYEAVIRDCTEALKYNGKYVKALHRRAKAYEITKQLEPCLEDITAVCILEAFQNQSSLLMADRVLKELGKEHAKEAMMNRQSVIPSKHFVNTFMCSFAEDPVFNLLKRETQQETDEAKGAFAKALDKLKDKEFDNIIELCTNELDTESSDIAIKRLARLLRGTFLSLLGEHEKALEDLSEVFNDPDADPQVRVNALVKRATLRMQLGSPEESLHDLLMAAELGPENADVFHHRGQVYMLLDQANEAISDFAKAVSLNGDFPIALVQKLYTDYRAAVSMSNAQKVAAALTAFEDAIRRFPSCPECYLLYAQVLSDQQEFQKADEYFMKALDVDPENATAYVHRGLLQLQSAGNVELATKLIEEAIRMDNKCEFAYETLGTIEVQRGNLRRAIELFDQAIPLSKTEAEVSHLFSLKDAALAQLKVALNLGVTLPSPMN